MSVEQVTYEDFLFSIPSPTLLTIFKMAPLNGHVLMEYNNNLSFPLIDLLFGGMGRKTEKNRQLTDIELGVLRKVNEKILENMALAWESVLEIEPVLDTLETNPQLSQIISPNETVAIITFSADIVDNRSLINLCIPYVTIKDELTSLTTQHWFSNEQYKGDSGEEQKVKENRLNEITLNLSAFCAETTVTVRDILELGEGDIILLDKKIGNDMDLFVEEYPKYRGQPGIIDEKLALLITDTIEGE